MGLVSFVATIYLPALFLFCLASTYPIYISSSCNTPCKCDALHKKDDKILEIDNDVFVDPCIYSPS